jgi:urea transport system ATP-binding protein
MLRVKNLDAHYGESQVLFNVEIDVPAKSTVCILGRNGVGKTTLVRSIMGLHTARTGVIDYEEHSLMKISGDRYSSMGISYVPQEQPVINSFSVFENLKLSIIGTGKKFTKVPEVVYDYFPILKERVNQKAGTLSGGQKKMLAIARALVTDANLIILDEPTEGIQPSIVYQFREIIRDLGKSKGILLIEQNVDTALAVAEKGYIMEKGKIVRSDKMEILEEDGSITKYLSF